MAAEHKQLAVEQRERANRMHERLKSAPFAVDASPVGDESPWAGIPHGGNLAAVSAVEDRVQLKAIVARRLTERMDEVGMSIQRFADLLEVDRRDVRRWRQGQVFPAYHIHQIADALGTTVKWMTTPYEDADA